ncbi:MAG: polysaccharide deacetylase family protein [Pseudomonadales bacterium]
MSSGSGSVRALLSIHDVMPETLAAVDATLAHLAGRGIRPSRVPITLLVVPGRPWSSTDLDRLRAYERAGCELAGHGWNHKADRVRGLKHQLHSRLISRNVAEHLALDVVGITNLIRRCHAWFAANGFASPSLYVPPAWAMGPAGPATLAAMPFRYFETLAGVRDRQGLVPVPLLGFEADQPGRVLPLRAFNALNLAWCRRTRLIRIGLHPRDVEFAMRAELDRVLEIPFEYVSYSEIRR